MHRQRCNGHLVAVLILLLLGTHSMKGQDAVTQIRAILEAQVEAWNRGDIDGYMQGYWKSDSTIFISGGTVLRGWRTVLERYTKTYGTREKMGRLEFRELTIRLLSPTAAVAHGVWQLQRGTDAPWGRFTLILEKKQDGWRITQDHTSSAEK